MIKSTISRQDVVYAKNMYARLYIARDTKWEKTPLVQYVPPLLDAIEHTLKRGDFDTACKLFRLYEEIAYEH